MMDGGVKREGGAKDNEFDRDSDGPAGELGDGRGRISIEQGHQNNRIDEKRADDVDLQ